jgi:hypothetical protein
MTEGPIFVTLASAPNAPMKYAKIRLTPTPNGYPTLEVSDEGTPEMWTAVKELIT